MPFVSLCRYELLQVIGQGTYGTVRKCRNRSTGEIFAVKSIPKNKVPDMELLRKEVDLLSQVDHPNIIKLYETLEDDTNLHLVMELCTGGELYDRIIEKSNSPQHHFSEEDAARILRNILETIAYCHEEKKICHRDLKVENFLLLNESDDSPVKIIDFGLAKFNPDNAMTSKVGTVYYVAPEVVLANEYTNKCDVWSIGIIAYVLLCGFPPFHAENEAKTLEMVKKAPIKFPSPSWDDVSDGAKAFILRLLNRDSMERPSAKEALQDPWLNQQQYLSPRRHSRMFSFLTPSSFMSLFSSTGTSTTTTGTAHANDCPDESPANSASLDTTPQQVTPHDPQDDHDDPDQDHRHSPDNDHRHDPRTSGARESFSRFFQIMLGRKSTSPCIDDCPDDDGNHGHPTTDDEKHVAD
jgi:serine/threonine protein kinase